MSRAQRVAKTSPDLVAEQVERLQAIFPETAAEGKVDWDRLRATLGEIVDGRPERYSFTWAGKQDAIRALQTPSRAALIPCPEESVNWETTQHVFIEGENLEVLKLLYKAYSGRVKMICIDPPYNTGNDFIYPDNYADPLDTYLQLTEQKDSEGNLLTSNPQTSGRYHSAWLSMMYPRLFLARQLLREDGVIFVSMCLHLEATAAGRQPRENRRISGPRIHAGVPTGRSAVAGTGKRPVQVQQPRQRSQGAVGQ